MRMMLMECDDCQAEWMCPEKLLDEQCPACHGTAIRIKVSYSAMARMRVLLGTKETTPEQLKAAFAAITAGGETYADAVLNKTIELGHVELIEGVVWSRYPKGS